MKTIQEKLILLQETKDYYNTDVSRICRSDNKCAYSGKTLGIKSDGCAVGRLLTPEKRLELDEKAKTPNIVFSTVIQVWNDLPNEIQAWGKGLLTELQEFHDSYKNWDSNGITAIGEQKFNYIKELIKSDKI